MPELPPPASTTPVQDYLDRPAPGATEDHLVVPRSLAQSMPLRWQQVFVGLLADLHDAYGHLPWWVTGLILLREWGVTALRFWVIRYGIIPASRGGKLKTALQIAAIAWFLWPLPAPLDLVGPVLMLGALLVTVITGADYVVQALRLRRTSQD